MNFRLCLLLFILLLSGCAASGQNSPSFSDTDKQLAADFSDFPQDLLFFAAKADAEYGSLTGQQHNTDYTAKSSSFDGPSGYEELTAVQAGAMARAIASFFSPWSQTSPDYSLNMAMGGLYWLNPANGFIENLRPFPKERWEALVRNCDIPSYPSLALAGITVESCALRLMPTSSPYFFNPARPGQGYPFDYFQNSSLPVGTPVLITHISSDGAWVLIESPTAGGWVKMDQVAQVDKKFMIEWRSRPLAAIVKENAILRPYARPVAKAATEPDPKDFLQPLPQKQRLPAAPRFASIGTLLPYEPYPQGFTGIKPDMTALYYPAKGPDGMAVLRRAALPENEILPWPVSLTRHNIALLGNQMLNQPYGWGGYGGNRDCSSTLRDLLLPFGIWLPRNSKAQAATGDFIDLSGMSETEKEQAVLENGLPFLSLIGQPGHIALYLGEYNGQAAMFHNMWGLRINRPGTSVQGRAVVGKAVITGLSPGKERKDIASPFSLLGSINRLTWILGFPQAAP